MAVNRKIMGRVDSGASAPVIAPGICLLCQALLGRASSLCDPCIGDLPINHLACPVCAIPVLYSGLCAVCQHNHTPLIQRSICAYRYEFPISILVQEMKYWSRLGVASFLSKKIAAFVLESGCHLPQAIVPVPLHTRRLAQRGYNQSAMLASSVGQQLGIPVDIKVCRRHKYSLPQTDLPAADRRKNVRGVFAISEQIAGHYQHVAIVDDVVTTGSTVAEIAGLFLRAGTKRVDVWACARATI